METYCTHEDEEDRAKTLNLITYVEVQTACESDSHALIPALESATERGLAPEEVLADSLYGSDDNCQKAEAMDIEVISPAMGSAKEGTISLSEFRFSDRGKIIACPQGHAPVKTKHKKNRYTAAFECSACTACPMSQGCPVKPGKKHYHLRYDDKTMRIASRRMIEHTAEFKEKYRWRAGVEATMSQYDRITGVKRLRVRGFPAVRFCAILKAIGVNLLRATAVRKARRAGQEPTHAGLLPFQSVVSVVKEPVAFVRGLVKLIFSPFACPTGTFQAHFAS
jgi:hypothetical protein